MASAIERTKQPGTKSSTLCPTIGIVGGGQLSRMLCQAAAQLGIRTTTVERSSDCPAATVSHTHQVGDWNDPAVLRRLAAESDVVTLENEFVHADALSTLESEGALVYPSSECLRIIQDKLVQKRSLKAAGLPTPLFQDASSRDELIEAANQYGYPFLLKRRRNGYDGKGNFTVKSPSELDLGWNHLDGDNNPLFAEKFCDFQAEIAVMVCHSITGDTAVYPVVETIQKDHICHVVKAPASIPQVTAESAIEIAKAAVAAVKGTGSIGVELFLTKDNLIVVNELAPRVHNSGHYTIEGCGTSQFENHIRAILGLPLGGTSLVKQSAIMINLLGDAEGPSHPAGVSRALEIDGVHLHLYGKDKSQLGRKMGHITTISDSMDEALEKAQEAARQITFNRR